MLDNQELHSVLPFNCKTMNNRTFYSGRRPRVSLFATAVARGDTKDYEKFIRFKLGRLTLI